MVGSSDNNKLVVIDFNLSPETNALLPSRIKVMIGKGVEEFYYHRLNPQAEWGKNDFDLAITDYVEKSQGHPFFRLYGSTEPSKETLEAAKKEKVEEKKVEAPTEPVADAEETVINCPACTSFNPVTNTEC